MSPLRSALAACRPHLVAATWFSALVNLLYIAPTLYMLQVYDRVVPTHGRLTLLFLTLVLVVALDTRVAPACSMRRSDSSMRRSPASRCAISTRCAPR